jgi:hypothetical protein
MADQDTTKALALLDEAPAFISVPRAATILGFSRASAYRYAAAGELPTKRFGGRVYVITAKLREMIRGDDNRGAAA